MAVVGDPSPAPPCTATTGMVVFTMTTDELTVTDELNFGLIRELKRSLILMSANRGYRSQSCLFLRWQDSAVAITGSGLRKVFKLPAVSLGRRSIVVHSVVPHGPVWRC